ncbi:DnaB-like helicase N-terminal domain-containing protein [Escherichia coli]|uniref:DnaB-like helicase N-terminal domain-containing protein n=1 Tax=Escherichia coli TaxID=562 RepID=UPI00256EF8BF|nr:DnaB-like helicase N-terminal domain-containing protein [Escherichia coli]MDL5436351.1 DnaB-like helicase N-terminal domain-containing protein [Escherichia coli]
MTDNFYAPPHSIEAEQAVIGGLLLDDDSSERVQKVLAMLKPDSFYSRPHKILFEEITRMHREQKPVDGLTLFDELERKSLTASDILKGLLDSLIHAGFAEDDEQFDDIRVIRGVKVPGGRLGIKITELENV